MTTEHSARTDRSGESPADGGGDHPRYESFLWRLRLDPGGHIADTSIQHVGSGETRHWPAWDTADMLEFVVARSTQPAAAPSVPEPPVARDVAPPPARGPERADASGMAAVAALRLEAPSVAAGQPLRLSLDIDFGSTGDLPYRFVYDLVVMARRLDGDLHRIVARENGTLEVGRPRITVGAGGLDAGVYRLDAALTLSKPSIGFRGRTALVEGVMLTVLPA